MGTATGGGPEQFARIGKVITDSDERIYVLERLAREIRVFLPTGEFSHVIGQRGSGPGEFTMAVDMNFGPGDTLWVTDVRSQRYSAFARDGRFLRSVPRRIQRLGGPGEFMANDSYIDLGLGFPEERPGVVAGARILHIPVRLSPGFESQDSFPPLSYERDMMADGRLPQPFFSGDLATAVDRNGRIWFADSREYTIYRRSLDGDTSLVVTLSEEPAAIGERDRDYVRTMTARRPELTARYLAALPEFKPIVLKLFTDNAGHLFVIPETSAVRGGTAVDVFRQNGEYLGRIPLPDPISVRPPSTIVAHATSDYLYIVIKDDVDVPYLSRLKIIKPSDGD